MLLPGDRRKVKEPETADRRLFLHGDASELNGAKLKMAVLKNEDGRMMMLVTGVKLSENSKKYAVPLSEVKDADYWLEKAKGNVKFMSMITHTSKLAMKEGERIKPFSVQATDGTRWTDRNTLGRPLVLNFWYTGCGPCIREMPELSKWLDTCLM